MVSELPCSSTIYSAPHWREFHINALGGTDCKRTNTEKEISSIKQRHGDSAITKVLITVATEIKIDSLPTIMEYVFPDNFRPESCNSLSSRGLSLELVSGTRSQKFRDPQFNKR
jgi:hypothetical protein